MRLTVRMGIGFALFGAAALAELPQGVIYRNDFTTRESAGTIPESDVWHEARPYPSTTRQIISYASPDTYKEYHGHGFDVSGKHRWLYFHDLFHEDLYASGHATYDGWFHPNWRTGTDSSETGGYSNLWQHRFGINAEGTDADGNVNPSAWFYYDTATERQGYVLQPWHNSFTNGQLKIQVDMRAPLQWAITSPRHFLLFPVYDKYMRMEAWDGKSNTGEVSPGKFGFRCGGTAGRENRTYPMYYDCRKAKDGTTTQLGNNYSGDGASEKNCYWFRFEVTYDLETARFSGTVKSLDKDWITGLASDIVKSNAFEALPRPTFATTTSSLKSTNLKSSLWIGCATNAAGQLTTDLARLWREKGGLSGFALFVGQLSSSGTLKLQGGASKGTAIQPLVDNIRVSWKAPSATDFAVCYENDFQTRRYRTLSAPSATTTATYAPKTESVAVQDVFSGYPDGAINTYNILPVLTSSRKNAAGEPGVDGWRRHYWANDNSTAAPVGVYGNPKSVTGTGGKVMAFGWNASYSCLSQPIGTSFTSGKVTLQADLFLQGEWEDYTYVSDRNRAMLVLGSAAMHTADTAAFPTSAAASFGYRKARTGEENAYVYHWEPIAGPYGKATVLTGDPPEKNTWYRYRIVADLDKKTYDVTVWEMGEDSQPLGTEAPAEAFFTQTGIAFENDVTDIGSFAIYGYGYGNADSNGLNRRVLVDNIVVKHDDDTLYTNDFARRVRTTGAQPTATGYLAYEYNLPDGQDGWIRPDGVGDEYGWALATIRDDNGNACASFGAVREAGTSTRYGHVFGQVFAGERFAFSVDIRPPHSFKAKGGRASVTLGGRSLEQLQAHEAIADADKMIEFGFKGTATAYADGVGEAGVPFVGDQTLTFTKAPDLSHWYRFELNGKVSSDTCQMRVYDMGTTHPTVDTPKGTLVCSVSGLVPEKELSTGLSAFCLTAEQVGNTPGETGMDARQMLVDNIELKKIEESLSILIR